MQAREWNSALNQEGFGKDSVAKRRKWGVCEKDTGAIETKMGGTTRGCIWEYMEDGREGGEDGRTMEEGQEGFY